jgi:uncharacterized NAD(P)/FAD-binding protein YdhS
VHIDDPEAQTDAGYFYRRYDFGRYISELVSKELGLDQIDHIDAKVTNLYKTNEQIQFGLGRAKQIEVAKTVSVFLGDGSRVTGDRIFNCTGVGRDPLLSKLIADQVARPDALGKSIAVASDYRVSKSSGGEWNDLWMIGPATMGSLGDVIAASSIAKQAEQLSIQITSKQ